MTCAHLTLFSALIDPIYIYIINCVHVKSRAKIKIELLALLHLRVGNQTKTCRRRENAYKITVKKVKYSESDMTREKIRLN